MPDSLSGWFGLAAGVVLGDMFGVGFSGMEEQIGHGSLWNPEPAL